MARHKDPFARAAAGGGGGNREPNQVWKQAVQAHREQNFPLAEKLYRQVIKAAGPRPESTAALAAVLSKQGKHLEALKAIDRARKLDSSDLGVRRTQGAVLMAAGRPEQAAKVYAKVVAAAPRDPKDWAHLAMAQRRAGELEAARESFEKALQLDPASADLRHELALVDLHQHRLEAAERRLRDLLAEHERFAPAWLTLGNLRQVEGDAAAAVGCVRKAIEISPDSPVAWSNLGQTLVEAGDRAGAVEAYRKAIELFPEFAEARLMLAGAHRYTERDAEVAWIEQAVADERTGGYGWHDLLFAWSKIQRDLGEDGPSFETLHRANAAKFGTLGYDLQADLALFEEIRASYGPELLAGAATAGGCDDGTPIFVCGMPRSGTTLVEQILARHPLVVAAGELQDLGDVLILKDLYGDQKDPLGAAEASADTLRATGEEYVRRVRKRLAERVGTARHIVDKMPSNALRVGAIRRVLPNARILVMRRDARDTCLSNYRVNFEVGQHWSYDLESLGRYHRAHDRVVDHWVAHIDAEHLLEVSYEQLVTDLPTWARRICDFVGLPWDEAMLEPEKADRAVRTASYMQVREPVNAKSVGGWQRYADELQPLLEVLDATEAAD